MKIKEFFNGVNTFIGLGVIETPIYFYQIILEVINKWLILTY